LNEFFGDSRDDLEKLNLWTLRRPEYLLPQLLNDIDGLRLSYETYEINRKLRQAFAVNPLSNIKGSKAQFQAQYLEMQIINFNTEIL